MNQLSTMLGPIFFIVLQISILIVFLFFCLTPMKTKNIKDFTIITLLFILYNIFNHAKDFWGGYLNLIMILYIGALLSLLLYTTHIVATLLHKQYNKGFRIIMTYGILSPILILTTSFFQSGHFIRQVAANFFFTFPFILSLLIVLLFYFYKGFSKMSQLRLVLISGLVLAGSISLFFVNRKYIIQTHFTIVNLNFLLLTVFSILRHRRSIILKFFKGKKKSSIDPALNEHLKTYRLTQRQIEIAQQIIDGKSYHEIAENCHLALNTVTKHASNIFKKVGVNDKESFLKKIR
ncbi:MAG: hypothetical protein HWE22_03990 [Flavobacteriales bacterium]|nr:hypothetical protein [Flavobacteriales bacterium]